MKRMFFMFALTALACSGVNRVSAVELLISGNFESPGGATGEVPGWNLIETVTNSSESVDSASVNVGTDSTLFLKAFAGGGPLGIPQGNFDNDALPGGDVDGRDFLLWQRGGSPTPGSVPDLAIWQTNYGTSANSKLINARLLQTVPALAGDTYTFQGSSLFEEFYSGLVTTLGDASPHGQIASPTTTQFKMEFLNSAGNVIGSPTILDLRQEWVGNDPGVFLQHTPLVAVAPANTVNVRVAAEALNMAWNGSTSQGVDVGAQQSAYFNDFSLTRSGAPGTPLLDNGNLNEGTPDALDFWNQVETNCCNGQVLRTVNFGSNSNHTPGGVLGVWLSSFFGKTTCCGVGDLDPVDGTISQTVNAVAGGVYNFSGWTRYEAGYSGGVDIIANNPAALLAGQASPTETEIKLEFLDINNNVLSSLVLDTETDRKLQEDLADDGLLNGTGTANDGVWRQHVFTNAVAPANTIFARLSAQMIDGVFNTDPGQSAFFDDFSLTGPAALSANLAVPEPSSVALIAFGLAAMGLRRGRKIVK